jgi:hypothetical protein
MQNAYEHKHLESVLVYQFPTGLHDINRAALAIFCMHIEQLPTHFKVHKATLDGSVMSIEQEKLCQTGSKP